MHRYVERVVDLLDPSLNVLHDMTEDEARARVLSAAPDAVRGIEGRPQVGECPEAGYGQRTS